MSGNIVLPKLAVFGPEKEGEGDALGQQKQRRTKHSKRRASVLPSVPHAQTSRTAHGKPPAVEKTTSSLKIDVRHSGEFLPTIQEPRHAASTGESTGGMKNKFLTFLYLQHAVYGTGTYGQRGRAIRDRTDKNKLSVEGTDIRLPPPKAPTEPRRKSLQNVKSTSTVSSESSLENQAPEADDPQTVQKRLHTLMSIHSMGIPIEITNKDYVPGVICRPLFHCARCRDVWDRLGEVPGSCDQPSRPVRGNAFWLTREASTGLMQGVDPKSQAIRMKAGRHGDKLLLMGATTGSHRLLYDDEASSLLSLLRDLRHQAAARREEEEDDDYWSYGTDEFSEEDLDVEDDGKEGTSMRASHRKEERRRAQKASVRRRGSLETAPESHASSQDSGFTSQQGGGAGHGLLPMLLRILEKDSRPGSTKVLGDLDERQLVLQLLDASDDIDDAAWAEEGAHFLNSLKSNHVVRLTPNNLPALVAEIKRGTIAVQTGPDGSIRLGTYGPDGVFVPFEASDEDGRPISEQFARMLESTLTSQLTQVLSSGGSTDPDSKGAAGLLKALMNNSDLAASVSGSDVMDIVNKLREHLADDKQTKAKEGPFETARMADFMIDIMKTILKDGKLLTEDEVKQVLKSGGNEDLLLKRLSDGRLYFGVKDHNGEFVPFGTYGEDGVFYFGAMDGNGTFQLTGRVDHTGNFEPGVVKDDGLFHVVEDGVSEAMASVMSKLKGQPGWLKQYVETRIRRQEVVVHIPDHAGLDVTGEGTDLSNDEDTDSGKTAIERQKRSKDDPLYDIRAADGPTTSDLRQQYDSSSYEPFQRDAKGQKPGGQTDSQAAMGKEGRTGIAQDVTADKTSDMKGREGSFMSSRESSSLEPRLEKRHKVMIGSKNIKTLRQGKKAQESEKIKNKYVKNRTGKPDTQPGKLADYPSTPAQETGTPSLVSREGTFSSMVGSETSISEALLRQRRVSVSSNQDNSVGSRVPGSDGRAVQLGADGRDGLAVQTEETGSQDTPSRKRREVVKKTRLSNQATRYPNRANQGEGMADSTGLGRGGEDGMAGSQQDLKNGQKLASLSYKRGTDLSDERLNTIGIEGDDSNSLPARGLAPLPKSVKRSSDVQGMLSPTPHFPDPKRNTLPPLPKVDNAGRASKSPRYRRSTTSLAAPVAPTTEGDLDGTTEFTVSASNKNESSEESTNSTETESGSSDSSSESEFESVSRKRQRHKIDLPDLDGISALSFTRAFTYSYLPLPLAYRERNNKLKARAALFNQLKKPIRPAKKARPTKQDIGVNTDTKVDKTKKEKKTKSNR